MLTEPERRIIRALAGAMLPMREEPFRGVDVPAAIDDFMQGAPLALTLSTRLAMWAVELGPVAWGFGPTRFTSMDREQADRYLSRWDRSSRYTIRSLFFALKVVVMGLVYDRPEVEAGFCRGRG